MTLFFGAVRPADADHFLTPICRLHDDLGALLIRLREGVVPAARQIAADPAPIEAPAVARAILALRRQRATLQGIRFADPAWDMMLDLLVAEADGKDIAVSSLCIAAGVPPTTALRWIKALTESGLFLRVPDPKDGRRIFIRLSPALSGELVRLLVQWRTGDG